jgi:O-antigen ligase
MLNFEIEKKLATYLCLGTFFVTVFLLADTNTDPVNVTKLFALGGVSIAVLGVSLAFGRDKLFSNFKPILIAVVLFDLIMVFASVMSEAPFSQNFFGAFGRNNGLLTYALFSAITVSSLLISKFESFEKIIYALFAAGLLNIAYCAWVLAFGDFIPWNNPYGKILGFFGNPDFISAFLGMFIACSIAFIASVKTAGITRIFLGLASIVALFEIVKSHAIQGLVVTAGGIAIVGFYFLRSRYRIQIIAYGYAAAVAILGLVAIFGTLQKGPLSFVYKRSVSLRGSYWHAGIEMGNSHPFTGVGLDTYGDWYRRTRPPVALIDTPGINTMSNVAHNVVIDFFASGGFPLLISYLAILAFGAISIIRVTVRNRNYDRIFVGITVVWLCYQVQSFISINQIGLAIWGWLFTGLLVAYEHTTRPQGQDTDSSKSRLGKGRGKAQVGVITPQLVAGIGLGLGVLIALPPLSADSKWHNATKSQDAAKVQAALVPSFFNPPDSSRYAQAVNIFQNSNLLDLAHKYAIIAVKFNPDYSVAWKQLYYLPNVSTKEKATALYNIKRLDPNNPDPTTTQ